MGAAAHLSYCITLIYAVFVILASFAAGEPWMQLALITLVIPLLAPMKGALRTVGVDELMPQWRGPLTKMELGMDDARAGGAIPIFLELYPLIAFEEDPLERDSLRACIARRHTRAEILISDPPVDIRKIEPDFHAAEVRTFGADRCGNSRANVARRTDDSARNRESCADLSNFFQRCLINLFLGVEAGPHGPFMQQMQQRTSFDQANRLGIRQQIKREFRRDAAVESSFFAFHASSIACS